MITPEEYIRLKPRVIYMHAIDCLEHVLKADYRLTAYQDNEPSYERVDELRNALDDSDIRVDEFREIVEEVHRPEVKLIPFKSDEGELQLDRYIGREELCFDDYEKTDVAKPCLSIILDMSIAYSERRLKDMEERHRKVYRITVDAEQEGRPCRVIACYSIKLPEFSEPMVIFLIIKDYCDPIFPGIWAALKSNLTANALVNCVIDFLIGSHAGHGNGTLRTVYIDDYLDDEIIIIDGRRALLRGDNQDQEEE